MRVGILGGSFDPIHCGHLHVARQAIRYLSLDRVVIMPARIPPHKCTRALASGYHRYAMAVLATQDDPCIGVSTLELEKPGPSFTVETLAEIRTAHSWEFCFIGGGDSLKEVHLWKDCAKLFQENCLVFVPRPGVKFEPSQIALDEGIRSSIQVLTEQGRPPLSPGSAYYLQLDTAMDVSSSEVRGILAQGRHLPEGRIPPSVYQYIQKNQLYG